MSPFALESVGTREVAIYKPPDYSTAHKWPLILFLHGAGEAGDDPMKPTLVGIGPALERYPERYPAVVVLPQCPGHLPWRGRPLNDALTTIETIVAREAIDEQRVYLTGISMGGFGSLLLATLHPRRFAAVVPICGGGDPARMAPILSNVPLWIFHGADDQVVPVEYSREMVAAIRRVAPKAPLKYTEYPGVEHNSWDPAYAERHLPEWLFSHRRSFSTE